MCRICGETKDINNFPKCDKMADGYRNECKKCSNKIYRNKERERERNLEKEIKIGGNKICRICGENKNIDQFHIKRGTPDGHRSECKECIKLLLNKYKDDPNFKDKQKEYDKKRYKENKESILNQKKEYHKENKDSILKKKKEYRKDRGGSEKFKIWREKNLDVMSRHQANYRKKYPHIVAWRSVLYSTLKRLGTKKESHTIDMLGYSALQLKEHLEKRFSPGMTWKNHGEWHIDHIRPVSKFSNIDDIKIVCALENLQPLWAFDNLSKNNKIVF